MNSISWEAFKQDNPECIEKYGEKEARLMYECIIKPFPITEKDLEWIEQGFEQNIDLSILNLREWAKGRVDERDEYRELLNILDAIKAIRAKT